jgi:hypothetical protein
MPGACAAVVIVYGERTHYSPPIGYWVGGNALRIAGITKTG